MAENPKRWRWVVLVASFTAFVTLGMSLGSMQYFYDEMLERFGESAAVTAGPVSLFLSLGFVTGKQVFFSTFKYSALDEGNL